MRIWIYFILSSLLFIACEQKPVATKEDVYEIRNIGQLSTTEYTVRKIVKVNDASTDWYKYGDRKLLISCRAKIKAGIDLTKINEKDIQIRGKEIEITLPPAEITSFQIHPSDIQTELESVTGFRSSFSQAEKNEVLKKGEQAIKKDLATTQILRDAEINAALFVTEFYAQLGFEKIVVHHNTLPQ